MAEDRWTLTAAERAAQDRLQREDDPTYPSPYAPGERDSLQMDDMRLLVAACARLARERDDLGQRCDPAGDLRARRHAEDNAAALQARAEQAEALAERRRVALETYGQHADGCEQVYGPRMAWKDKEFACTCGLAAALEDRVPSREALNGRR